MEITEKFRAIIIITVIAGFVILWNLGTGSLVSWDEAVYAQVSKEMFQSGNYTDMTWAGSPWSDKPPLYMWATALFYKIFNVNEFSARLFSAICGIGTIIVTYLLGSKLYTRRVGFAAALILVSTYHFIWASKAGMLDSALTFFMTLSLYWLIMGIERQKYLFFFTLAFGCAFLTKGFGALLIPITAVIYLLCAKKFRQILKPSLWAGLLITILIVGYWHFLVFSHYGKNFVDGYVIQHFFTRVSHTLDGHTGTIFTYLKAISNKGRPWGIAALLIIPAALWQVFTKKEKTALELPLIWALVMISIFSIVKTKLHWYIIPVYPAISMLTGWGLDKILNKKTVPFILISSLASLFYLTVEKNIFNLDYSHHTKSLASLYKEKAAGADKIYIFDDDPAIRFYFLDKGINVFGSLSAIELLKKKNSYIVLSKRTFDMTDKSRASVVAESPDFVIIKTE